MIPVKLTIEGLYSYQKRQTIDFSQLTKAGLFGVFGAVGSGKSSILEAVTFALYGETERLNKMDKRAYNMMNLKSSRSYIEFDFINHQNQLFRVTREYKRHSRHFEKIDSASKTVFYECINDKWIPLEHTNIQNIINLTYDNFKRTIIIPQGKFREFIDLSPAERTRMMKEIYHLHRFDLQENTTVILKETKEKLEFVKGKLSGFEEVSEQKILELEQLYSLCQDEEKKARQQYHIHYEILQHLKLLKNDFENLEQKKEIFITLSNDKVLIDEKDKNIKLYEIFFADFHEPLSQLDKNTRKSDQFDRELNEKRQLLQVYEKEEIEIKKSLDRLHNDFENLPNRRNQETDLKLISEICRYAKESEILKSRIEKGNEHVKDKESKQLAIEKRIECLEREAEHLNKEKIDSRILSEVGNWFNDLNNLNENFKNQHEKIVNIQDEIKAIEENAHENLISENDFEAKELELNRVKNKLLEQKNSLEVRQKLSLYAHDLQDGKPCPLCGAIEHPEIHTEQDISQDIVKIDNKIKILDERYNNLKELMLKKNLLQTQLLGEKTSLENMEMNIKKHYNQFVWKMFSPMDQEGFRKKQKMSFEIERKIEEINTTIFNERKKGKENQETIQKYRSELEKIKLEENVIITKIKLNKSNLTVLNYEHYTSKTYEYMISLSKKLKDENDQIEREYCEFIKKLADISIKLSIEKVNFKNIYNNFENLKSENHILNDRIQDLLNKYKIKDVAEVRSVLSSGIDIQKSKQEVSDFKIRYEALNNTIKELEDKLKGLSFSQEDYLSKETELEVLEQNLKEKTKIATTTQSEIENLKKRIKTKGELLKEESNLQKRMENLNLFRNLFMGAGFVQYASLLYLNQLCDMANHRFRRMTKNQLSLQFNENGGFEVIDYLNEGRVRSVKTLSGGQYFQVALSLALALADSVQSESANEKRFFFIDEGFGSLDEESITIVFETLKNLKKENKIVGIISHVEELKEKIPMSINVVKHEQNGSIIYQ